MHRPGIIGGRPHHGGGGYVGPLDIVPGAALALSQQAMSAALRGSALYTIADGAGGATQSFNSDATTGDAPSSAIQAYSATPFVSIWNDQSGNANNAVQAVTSRPAWAANVSGGKPGLSFSSVVPQWLGTGDITLGDDITIFTVILVSTGGVGVNYGMNWSDIDGPNGPDLLLNLGVFSGKFRVLLNRDSLNFDTNSSLGTDFVGPLDQVSIVDLASSSSNGSVYINGTDYTTVMDFASVGDAVFPFGIGNSDVGQGSTGLQSSYTDGKIIEHLVYNKSMSDARRLEIRQNRAAAYGIPLS